MLYFSPDEKKKLVEELLGKLSVALIQAGHPVSAIPSRVSWLAIQLLRELEIEMIGEANKGDV